jgi:hypothetical protein
MPMPRAKDADVGRALGGLDGEGDGTTSACGINRGRSHSGIGFCPVGNRLMGRLQGVSGMFLLKPSMVW